MDEDLYKKERTYYHQLMHLKRPVGYKYYDTPDGHDLLPKVLYTTKLGFFAGFVYGGYMALTRYPFPKSRAALITDGVRRGFPFVLFPIVYTTATYALTNIRKKDEVLNAQIGGAIAGAAFGLWHRNGWVAFYSAIAAAIACGLKKRAVEMGFKFPQPEKPRSMESSWVLRNMDFTLTEDIPGDWVAVPPPSKEVPPPPPPPPPPPQGICAGF